MADQFSEVTYKERIYKVKLDDHGMAWYNAPEHIENSWTTQQRETDPIIFSLQEAERVILVTLEH